MQHPLSNDSFPAPTFLLLGVAAPAMGLGAAWVSAKLAHGDRPSRRLTIWMIGAHLLLTVSILAGRPEAVAWSLGLGSTLILLASVDLASFRLPDKLTLPLTGGGMVYAALSGGDLVGHGAGLLLGYGSIAVTGWVFARLRRRQGIGLGDAKLFAAAGAWLGWAALPSVMLIACGLGLAWFAVTFLRNGRNALMVPAPFGVALCCGTWAVWLLG